MENNQIFSVSFDVKRQWGISSFYLGTRLVTKGVFVQCSSMYNMYNVCL